MIALLLQWLKANRVMLINAGSLVGTTLVTGALGFAYWWVADRQFRPEAVGLASAAISAMMLLGALCVLGLGTLLIGELPRQPGKEASLISTALLLVGIVGGLGGIIFALVAPFTSTDFLPLRESVGNVLIFAVGASLTAITIVLDQALIGLLYGGTQFLRNALFAAAKLATLFIIAFLVHSYTSGVAIYATWALGNAISLIPLIGYVLVKKRALLKHALPDWTLLRKLGLPALQHHILNLIIQVPTTGLPVLVTILLSATTNAWFYTAWMITGFVFIAAYALTTVLYAINSAQTEELARKIRLTLGLAFATSLGANIVLQIGASQILGLFGHVYAEQATWSLRILSLGAFPMIIKYHYIAVKRIDQQLIRALLPVGFGSLLELGIAAFGAHQGGLLGLSVGWVAAVCVEALFMSPVVFRALRFKATSITEADAGPATASLVAEDEQEKTLKGLHSSTAFEEEVRELVVVGAVNRVEQEEVRELVMVAAAHKAEQPKGEESGVQGEGEGDATRRLPGIPAAYRIAQEEAIQLPDTPKPEAEADGEPQKPEEEVQDVTVEETVEELQPLEAPIAEEQQKEVAQKEEDAVEEVETQQLSDVQEPEEKQEEEAITVQALEVDAEEEAQDVTVEETVEEPQPLETPMAEEQQEEVAQKEEDVVTQDIEQVETQQLPDVPEPEDEQQTITVRVINKMAKVETAQKAKRDDVVEAQQLLSTSVSIAGEQKVATANADKQVKAQRLPKFPTTLEIEPEDIRIFEEGFSIHDESDETVRLPSTLSLRAARRRYCIRCHALLAPNAKFCRNCGADLSKIESIVRQSTAVHVSIKPIAEPLSSRDLSCPQCHATLPSYAKFCSSCGKQIDVGDKKRTSSEVLSALATVILPICALIVWALSLQAVHIDLRSMNNLGLVSIFPPQFIGALFVITLSFCLALWQKRLSVPVLLLHVLILIFMLYGLTALVEDVPRFAVVYRHAGYTDFIIRHQGVDPNLDAYFSWPGFFIYNAFLVKILGYQSILPYSAWTPVFFNLIYLGPIYIIANTFTTDKRIMWLSFWIFYVTNWIGQDYISPQGLNFFMYLMLIAILVKWFKVAPADRPHTLGPRWKLLGPLRPRAQRVYSWLMAPDEIASFKAGKWQRVALMGSLIAVFGFMVFSHPLTPFLAIASVTALVVLRRCNPFWLPVVMIIMTAGWLFFMAQPYLQGNINSLIGDFTNVSSTISENVTSRVVQGDAQHNFISDIRLGMTLLIWALAFLGGVMRLRKGYRDVTYVLLAVAPFPVLLVQSYGGEMLLRIYLFTLPMMSLFVASIFYVPFLEKRAFWGKVAIAFACIVLTGTFMFTRYGNERMDYMTRDELAGVDHLYSIAPKGSYMLEAWNGTPWEAYNYEQYIEESLEDDIPDAVTKNDINALIRLIITQPTPKPPRTYVIFTRAQRATADIEGLPPGTLDRYEHKLLASKHFVLVYENRDVQILLYTGGN